MGKMDVTYSHAAPYIRGQIMNAAMSKLNAKTQKKTRYHTGQMFGLVSALKILLASPEGHDSPVGFPEFTGVRVTEVLAEVERFIGGRDQMDELGFTEGKVPHEH